MLSLTTTFNRATVSHRDFAFFLLLWLIFIDNDRKHREEEQLRKWQASRQPRAKRHRTDAPALRYRKPKPPAPRPF